MAQGVQAWSTTAGSNGSVDANINFAEGQSPPSLNNSARALMAAVRALYNSLGGGVTYGGSANAYTITNDSVGAWTAYAEGQIIGLEANHTNNGAATVNVDALGAKSIVKSASTAAASGDIVSGAFYLLRYDGTNFQIVGGAAATSQPLDATLTALAALSWSSGNALVQFTAADTVSLTLAPSVTSVTASNGTAAGTPAGRFVNTTDNATVQGIVIVGDRATPANNDSIYASFELSNGSGTQKEVARVTVQEFDVTAGSEDAQYVFAVISGGSLTSQANLGVGAFRPNTNDLLTLGTTSAGWADLHLATGGVINWANGLILVTHSASTDSLEVTGGGFAAPALQVPGVGGETLAAATHRNRMLLLDGNITIDDSIFAAGDYGMMIGDGSDRTVTRASGCTLYVNGVDSATATIPAHTVAGFVAETTAIIHLTGSAY